MAPVIMPELDLASLPGVRYAALISQEGSILDSVGDTGGDPLIGSILAHGTASAAGDLGMRSLLGTCAELAISYTAGGIFILLGTDGSFLLLEHSFEAPLDAIRVEGKRILSLPQEKKGTAADANDSLMDALNAGGF